MNNALDGMFPIGSVRREIETRWIQVASQSFSELEQHVAGKNPDPHAASTYEASFEATRREKSNRAAGKKGSRSSRWFRLEVAQLEHAVAWCTAAKRLEPKALANMLASARDCCSRFDQLVDDEKAALAASKAHRVKGGKYRQARLDPVRELARFLAKRDRPAGGWKSHSATAKAIAPEVRSFITARGLSMQTDDSLSLTLAKWLRKGAADKEE